VPYVDQYLTNWCWAACAAMVLQYYGLNVDKCDVAAWVLNQTCCPERPACDQPCEPSKVRDIYVQWKRNATLVAGPVPPQTLIDELRPAGLSKCGANGRCGDQSDSGHLVLVYGWHPTSAGDRFLLLDPQYAQGYGPVHTNI